MSLPIHGSSTKRSTINDDPFISPKFRVRNQNLSSTSRSITSPVAARCSDTSTFERRHSARYWWPSRFRFQISCLRAIPVRWLCVLLCLIATFLVWRRPPSLSGEFAFHFEEQYSYFAPRVLRPHDSSGSRRTDPEQWLRENSEEALLKEQRSWITLSKSKPRAAIITLVRNEELEGIMQSMRQLEYRWNKKYEYPWVFFNEKPFSDEFRVRNQLSSP